MPKPKARCWEESDCADFSPCEDPGGTTASGRDDIRWEKCSTCGMPQPIYRDSGRFASFTWW